MYIYVPVYVDVYMYMNVYMYMYIHTDTVIRQIDTGTRKAHIEIDMDRYWLQS